MLVELAAANAAYKTISTFIKNGKEIGDAIAPIKALVTAEEDLRARGERKKQSAFSKLLGKDADTFDEFMALEKIAENRKSLESMMRLYAAPGTFDRFIAFEAKVRVQRKKEAQEREKQIAQMIKYVTWGLVAAFSIGGFVLLYFFTEFLRGLK